ncbi:MAG: SCP2 sterol-binding domain-containing protein [Burkholderiaceae bacterium]|nr:SCP2 sterol-binding domain-containing protein [Burkholderiaceae bacterium]
MPLPPPVTQCSCPANRPGRNTLRYAGRAGAGAAGSVIARPGRSGQPERSRLGPGVPLTSTRCHIGEYAHRRVSARRLRSAPNVPPRWSPDGSASLHRIAAHQGRRLERSRRHAQVPNTVSNDDKEADCTVGITLENLTAMLAGDLEPATAFMTGKLRVSGDMSVALKLQRVV